MSYEATSVEDVVKQATQATEALNILADLVIELRDSTPHAWVKKRCQQALDEAQATING